MRPQARKDPNIWSDIRNMKTPHSEKDLIITMCIPTIFQNLIIGTMVTLPPGERDACADRHCCIYHTIRTLRILPVSMF